MSIEKDGDLASELANIKVDFPDGLIKIQSKKDMRKSPNSADALLYTEYALSIMQFRENKHRLPQIWMPGVGNINNKNNNNSNVSRTGYG
jgi:hypothetical protein